MTTTNPLIKNGYYAWPPPPDDVHRLVRVTSITDEIAKQKFLTQWAAKEVATYAAENILQWEKLPTKDAIDLLKRAPYRNMRGKGDRGTAVHAAIAAWVEADPENPPEVDPDLLPYVAGAIQFLDDHAESIVHTEATCFNLTYQYAGTFDAIYRNEGGLILADWKTSKHAYPEYALQLCGYAHAEFIGTPQGEQIPMPALEGGMIVHLPGDGTYKAHPVTFDEQMWRTFIALRTMKAWRDERESTVYGEVMKG